MENSIVRRNLLTEKGYTPYCGNNMSRDKQCGCSNPRTFFNGKQFICKECGWISKFPQEFITLYKTKWNITI